MKKVITLTYEILLAAVVLFIWYVSFEIVWFLIRNYTPSTKHDKIIHDLITGILGLIAIIKGIQWYMKKYYPNKYQEHNNIEKNKKVYKIHIDLFS